MIIIGGGVSIGDGISVIPERPTTIGQAFGGGYYAGLFNANADGSGIPTHYLIVAPKETGEMVDVPWSVVNTYYGASSYSDGPNNTSSIMANSVMTLEAPAALFCGDTCNQNGGIGGFTDWYMPALYELDVIYYFLKPNTTPNFTRGGVGDNPCAVAPQPINTYYTSGDPAVTSAGLFTQISGNQYFIPVNWEFPNQYASSTEYDAEYVRTVDFAEGATSLGFKVYQGLPSLYNVRAIRRIPV